VAPHGHADAGAFPLFKHARTTLSTGVPAVIGNEGTLVGRFALLACGRGVALSDNGRSGRCLGTGFDGVFRQWLPHVNVQ
jgi:hypothetical protein